MLKVVIHNQAINLEKQLQKNSGFGAYSEEATVWSANGLCHYLPLL